MKQLPGKSFLALTIKHNGRSGRIVTDVTILPAFDPRTTPNPGFEGYKTTALWDTGATSSVITGATAVAMGLKPVSKTQVNHANGTSEHNVYLVNMVLPNEVMVTVKAVEAHNIVDTFGAIIGMDIITRGDFAITNVNGETCMSFRIPSLNMIDYVEEYNQIQGAQKCWCGSGRKLRECHRMPPQIAAP